MTHSCVCHDSFKRAVHHLHSYVTWRIHMWHNTFTGMTNSTFICDMTNCAWSIPMSRDSLEIPMSRDSFENSHVTWLIWAFPCHVTHLNFPMFLKHSHVTWLIWMWHDSFIRDVTYSYVTWRIHKRQDAFMCDVIHSYVWHVTSIIRAYNSLLWYPRIRTRLE